MRRILRNTDNGALYIWTPALAVQAKMVEVTEAVDIPPAPEPAPEEPAEVEPTVDKSGEYLGRLEAMSKEDIDLFAKEEFGLELDRRKAKATLVSQVMDAAREIGVI